MQMFPAFRIRIYSQGIKQCFKTNVKWTLLYDLWSCLLK